MIQTKPGASGSIFNQQLYLAVASLNKQEGLTNFTKHAFAFLMISCKFLSRFCEHKGKKVQIGLWIGKVTVWWKIFKIHWHWYMFLCYVHKNVMFVRIKNSPGLQNQRPGGLMSEKKMVLLKDLHMQIFCLFASRDRITKVKALCWYCHRPSSMTWFSSAGPFPYTYSCTKSPLSIYLFMY